MKMAIHLHPSNRTARKRARGARAWALLTIAIFLNGFNTTAQAAQLWSYTGFQSVFGYDGNQPPASFHVQCVSTSAPGNVFWPGEEATFNFQIVNKTDQPMKAAGRWEVIQYSTRCRPIDPLWGQIISKIKDVGSVPATADIPAKSFVNQTVKLPIPAEFGGYAVMLVLEGQGREVAATCVRSIAATPGKVQFPAYACDIGRPELVGVFQRIGVKGTRQEWGFFKPDDKGQWDRLDQFMKAMSDNHVTVMMCVSTGGDGGRMPMNSIRGYLNDKAEGKMDYPGDFTALPQYDEEFQGWVRMLTEKYGWPKGPVNAIELWNEPWEGISCAGWGADMPRYRELYVRMAQGVEEARKNANVQVLIGGTCSSMNTEDKLFPDGKDDPFLKWLDFSSIHYQPLCAEPALIKRFVNRKSPHGPTRVWDTESWMANSEDRVAGMIASMRALGQERTAGVNHDQVRDDRDVEVFQADGTARRQNSCQALPAAAAIAAMQQFMGQRNFKEILFKNGLPWVFVFDGQKSEDDGTVVVVGDIGAFYDRELLVMRGLLGLDARKRSLVARAKLAALPPDALEPQRNEAINEVRMAEILDNASMTISDGNGHFVPYDFYGNPVPVKDGKIAVALNGFGYFLRTDGTPGSFAKLIDAIETSRIEGYEPIDVVARDLLSRVESKPGLQLTLTNILNRPITTQLEVKLGQLALEGASQQLKFAPHETKELTLKVTGGQASADNSYPLEVSLDAGADGRKVHTESLHVNVIARTTIGVDGDLADWQNVLPQPIRSSPGAGKNLTEKAWLPFVKFNDPSGKGYASGYLAYDDQNFYFAAKIADTSPYDGNVRFANRNDDDYFYPDVAWDVRYDGAGKETHRREMRWPEGMRHFSYRKDPDLPSGMETDNVQIAFNVLPIEQTDWLPNPPGTMPRFGCYKSTDYEYALNQVAEKHGGGAEIWRLLAPGVPRKHFYPRQPKVPAPGKDGGPVADGKLVMRREGNVRLIECAIPWSEIPDVKKRCDAGEPIKFTFRVNDNKGPAYESNENRSVSKADTYALHNFWQTSWAVETEYVFEK